MITLQKSIFRGAYNLTVSISTVAEFAVTRQS